MYTVISTTGDRTSDHRAETLQQSQQFILHTNDAKLTSHGRTRDHRLLYSADET